MSTTTFNTVDELAKYFDFALKISDEKDNIIISPPDANIAPFNALPSDYYMEIGRENSVLDYSPYASDYSTDNERKTSKSGSFTEDSDSSSSSESESSDTEYSSDSNEKEKTDSDYSTGNGRKTSQSGSSSEDSDSSSSSESDTSDSEYSSDDDKNDVDTREIAMKKYDPLPKLIIKKKNLSSGLMKPWPKNRILKLCKSAGVANGQAILSDLDFDLDKINITQLISVMEEKISNPKNEPQTILTKACFVLQSEELVSLREFSSQLLKENAKLRADTNQVKIQNSLLEAKLCQSCDNVGQDSPTCLTNHRGDFADHNSKLKSKPKLSEQKDVKPKINLSSLQKWKQLQDKEQQIKKEIDALLEKGKCRKQKELTKAKSAEQAKQIKSMAIKRRRDGSSQLEEGSRFLKIRKFASKQNNLHN